MGSNSGVNSTARGTGNAIPITKPTELVRRPTLHWWGGPRDLFRRWCGERHSGEHTADQFASGSTGCGAAGLRVGRRPIGFARTALKDGRIVSDKRQEVRVGDLAVERGRQDGSRTLYALAFGALDHTRQQPRETKPNLHGALIADRRGT